MSYLSQSKSWFLSSYSRFIPNRNLQVPGENIPSGCNGNWATEEKNSGTTIRLSLTSSGHMIIHKNETILENVFLPFSSKSPSSSLKVLRNDTSLVFLYNVNCETRIFRVQFLSSETDAIKDCADNLSNYFTVRSSYEKQQTSDLGPEAPRKTQRSMSEISVPFSVLTSKIIQNKVEDLPKIYHSQVVKDEMKSNDSDDNFEHFLCLCLSDPSFSSYVGKVEKILEKFVGDDEVKENQEHSVSSRT